jgi:PhnB protein
MATDRLKTSITPWLSVRKSAQAVEFHKSAFGATEVYRFDGPDGSVAASRRLWAAGRFE